MSEFVKDESVFARERITVDGTTKQLSPSVFLDEANYGKNSHFFAKMAKIVVLTNGIYLDETGGTPSATRGVDLTAGQYFLARGIDVMRKLTMTKSGANNAEVEVVYYR